MGETPVLERIKNGWAAYGKGWAVHGTTEEEALRNFKEAEERHRVIAARGKNPQVGVEHP